jgi:hypothetical protein
MVPRRQIYRIGRAPHALRRQHARLDNIALVPASLLPYREEWQRIANELPAGSFLLCVPRKEGKQHTAMVRVARLLKDKGLTVRAIACEHVTRQDEGDKIGEG